MSVSDWVLRVGFATGIVLILEAGSVWAELVGFGMLCMGATGFSGPRDFEDSDKGEQA